MSQDVENALNMQLRSELESAYHYFGISAYFDTLSLNGFAQWFRVQAVEELDHAMRFYRFLQDRGANVSLPSLDSPTDHFESPMQAFESSLEKEQELTLQLHKLYQLSQQKREYDAQGLVQSFLQEQVEEESLFSSIVAKLKMAKENASVLLFMDKELGQRSAPDCALMLKSGPNISDS